MSGVSVVVSAQIFILIGLAVIILVVFGLCKVSYYEGRRDERSKDAGFGQEDFHTGNGASPDKGGVEYFVEQRAELVRLHERVNSRNEED